MTVEQEQAAMRGMAEDDYARYVREHPYKRRHPLVEAGSLLLDILGFCLLMPIVLLLALYYCARHGEVTW